MTVNPLFIPVKGLGGPTSPADLNTDWVTLELWAQQVTAALNGVSSGTVTIPNTYSVSGTLQVPSGATGYLPPFFWPVPSGQTVTLLEVRYMCRAGTATISIDHNGSAIATGLAVTTAPATKSLAQPVANSDYFAPVITGVSGADGLSVSFFFQVTG